LSPNRYELDLSNEVSIIHFGHAKIKEVKVGGRKEICQVSLGVAVSNLAELMIFLQPPTLTSDIYTAS